MQKHINLPSPGGHGWKIDSTSQLTLIPMTSSPSPKAILEFERCRCNACCTTQKCKCQNEEIVSLDTCSYDKKLCGNDVLHEQGSHDE